MDAFLHDLSWVLPLRTPAATRVFDAFTALGYFPFYLLLLSLGYWLRDRALFTRLAVLVLLSALLNAFLKDLVDDPRPALAFALDGRVGDSYGFPSGHAQVAAVTWLWLAREVRRPWFTALAGVLIAGICFSRLYLGVHDVEDVLGGLAIALITVPVYGWLQGAPTRGWQGLDVRAQAALLLAGQAALFACWPEPGGPGAALGLGAFLVGWWAGVRIERRAQPGASRPTGRVRPLAAAGLGLVGVVLLLTASRMLPATGPWHAAGTWSTSALIALFVTAGAPWLFRRLGLQR